MPIWVYNMTSARLIMERIFRRQTLEASIVFPLAQHLLQILRLSLVFRTIRPLPTSASLLAHVWKESFLANFVAIFRSSRFFGFLHYVYQWVFTPNGCLKLLLAFLCLIPYQFLPPLEISSLTIPYQRLLPLLWISLWSLYAIRWGRKPLFQRHSFFIPALIIWWAGGFISALQTFPLARSVSYWFYYEFTGCWILFLYFITRESLTDRVHLIRYYLGLVFFVAVYGLAVQFFGEPAVFERLWQRNLELNPRLLVVYRHFSPGSAFGNDSMRGSLIATIIPGLVIWLIMRMRQQISLYKKTKRLPAFAQVIKTTGGVSSLSILFYALYRCQTTSPWVAASLIFIPIVTLQHLPRHWKFFYSHSLKLWRIFIALFALSVIVGLTYSSDFDVQHRMIQWKIGAQIFSQHPVWGVGSGNYSHYAQNYQEYYVPFLGKGNYYDVADNYWLTFMVERGMAGILWLGVLIYILYKKLKQIFHSQESLNLSNLIALTLPGVIFLNGLFWDNGLHLSFRFIFFLFL